MKFEDLVDEVARKHRFTKAETAEVLESFFLALAGAVLSSPVRVAGFGVFEPRSRKARAIMNPVTRERMQLPKLHTVGFRPARALKRLAAEVARQRAHRRAA